MNRLLRWSPLLVGALGLSGTLAWMYRDQLFPIAAPPVATVEKSSGGLRVGGLLLSTGSTVGKSDTLELDAGRRATIRLPSGERIQIDGASSVELLKIAPSAASELWLHRGTVRVTSDEKRASPVLYTHEATTTGMKARFEVRATEGETTIRVALGHVHVEGLHETSATLAAGQRLQVARGDGLPPAQPQPDPSAISLDD